MEFKSLEDLLYQELKDLCSAETQLLKALPQMARAAFHECLRAGFEQHLDQTKEHVERLQRAASILDIKLSGHRCKAMGELIEEGQDFMHQQAGPSVRDAGLIAAAQRIEHYEIAGYGTARSLAELLGHDEVVGLLEETLEEVKETDRWLTEIAESGINIEAAAAADSPIIDCPSNAPSSHRFRNRIADWLRALF
jgi:ferritin-like metal-binding protein YciE